MLDLPGGGVALAGDREPVAARHHQLPGRHLVQRQRAGLVRADGRHRPERLDRGQPLHDGVVLGQHPRAHRVQRRDHGRQAGRDGRDGQGHAGEEQLVEGLVVPDARGGASRRTRSRRSPRSPGSSRSSCFCSGVLSASVWLRSVAMLPISVSIPVPVTIISPRPRVTDVFMNARQIRSPSPTSSPGIGASVLQHRSALAGERGLLDLQGGGHQQPTVGGHPVARLEEHDVARHQLGGVDLDRHPVAAHAGDVLQHLLAAPPGSPRPSPPGAGPAPR